MRGFEPLPAAQLPAVPSYSPSPQTRPAPGPAGVQAEIVIPVRNEERDLAPSVRRLHAYLRDQLPCTTRITIADNGSTDGTWWFFDTELLVLAERAGLRIHEVPVDWVDDADSRVKVIPTALADLRGIARLGTGLARGTITVPVLGDPSPRGLRPRPGQSPGRSGSLAGQLARFVAVGVTCTGAYILIYLLLRGAVSAQAANALSLLITAVANTALNRRLTFGIRGRAHAARHQLRGLIAFGIGLALTSGALFALHAASPRPSRAAEVTVLVLANLVATVVRFGLYRSRVFRGTRRAGRRPPAIPGQ